MQINSVRGYANQQSSRNRCSATPSFKGEAEVNAARQIITDSFCSWKARKELRFGGVEKISERMSTIESKLKAALAEIGKSRGGKSREVNIKSINDVTYINNDKNLVGLIYKKTATELEPLNTITYVDAETMQRVGISTDSKGLVKMFDDKFANPID